MAVLDRTHRIRWFVLSGLLAEMALDEVLQLHERIERVSGVSWQLRYAPVFLLAGTVWSRVLARIKPTARLLLVHGAAAWVASQGLEHFEWINGTVRVPQYNAMMVVEEVLEMAGSLMFLVALLRERRRAA